MIVNYQNAHYGKINKFALIMKDAVKNMNLLGKNKIPFFFLVDFEMRQPLVIPLSEIDTTGLIYDFSNSRIFPENAVNIELKKNIVGFRRYKAAFDLVQQHLCAGNSYLLNLTFPTQIETSHSLEDIFLLCAAKYKLYFPDKFVCFSPETFVKIFDNFIFSYPMKGTIDEALPDAKNIILNDEKEIAEHNTIVDLIRNDLSIVAKEVCLTRYRYIDKIVTNTKSLLQVSSEIKGKLPEDWNEHIGTILEKLLPAGSVSGAPKKKTLEIIAEAENYYRGYYTGIFGVFDGISVDSAVAIRFIEKVSGKYVYRSGGGITVNSNVHSEYNEMIDKIYVPVN